MNIDNHPAITQIRSDFAQLRTSARSTADVATWLLHNAALLREVSTALGHQGPAIAYKESAKVYRLEINEFENVYLSDTPLPGGDNLERYFKVSAGSEWKTDETIHLTKIFSELPDLGIRFFLTRLPMPPEYTSVRNMIFLPHRWPAAAAASLLMFADSDFDTGGHLEHMLEKYYPPVTLDDFKSLYYSGLFTDQGHLTQWLVEQVIGNKQTPVIVNLPDSIDSGY